MDRQTVLETRIQIPLKITAGLNLRSIQPGVLQNIIQDEYATRYCEKIGVKASPDTIQLIRASLPLEEALIAPNWTTQSLEIIPGKGNETAVQRHLRSIRDEEDEFIRNSITRTMIRTDNIVDTDETRKKSKVPRKKKINPMVPYEQLIANMLALDEVELSSAHLRRLVNPISFDEHDTGSALRSFFECISTFVPQLTDVGEVTPIHLKVISFLKDPVVDEFFGLILNYVYWNCIHPIARAVLKTAVSYDSKIFDYKSPQFMPDYSDEDSVSSSSQSASVSVVPSISSAGFASLGSETSMKSEEKEHLFLKLEDSNARLSKKMNFDSHDISIGQSAFVASCHFVVDELIKHKYKWFTVDLKKAHMQGNDAARDADFCRMQFQRAIHETISDILDPMRLFGTQLVRKEIVEQMLPTGAIHGVKGRFNATSAGVRALLGHPTSHEARKFMGLNSIRVFVPIPGVREPEIRKSTLQRGAMLTPLASTAKSTSFSINNRSINQKDVPPSPIRTYVRKEEKRELPLSTTAKTALFSLIKEQQKGKYSEKQMYVLKRPHGFHFKC